MAKVSGHALIGDMGRGIGQRAVAFGIQPGRSVVPETDGLRARKENLHLLARAAAGFRAKEKGRFPGTVVFHIHGFHARRNFIPAGHDRVDASPGGGKPLVADEGGAVVYQPVDMGDAVPVDRGKRGGALPEMGVNRIECLREQGKMGARAAHGAELVGDPGAVGEHRHHAGDPALGFGFKQQTRRVEPNLRPGLRAVFDHDGDRPGSGAGYNVVLSGQRVAIPSRLGRGRHGGRGGGSGSPRL